MTDMTVGVPQGSILVPTLLLLTLNGKLQLCANDTCIVFYGKSQSKTKRAVESDMVKLKEQLDYYKPSFIIISKRE